MDIEPQFAGADAEDIKITNTNCTPRFASRRLQPNHQISAGHLHSVALKSDGTVVAWGWNASGQTDVPAGLSGVVAVSAGSFHSLAVRADGTVVAWGANSYGQTTVPPGLVAMVP